MPILSESINDQDHFQGALNAPATLVEYGDYECLACRMTLPIIKQLQREIGEKMCYVFRHFPKKASHPLSFEAAKAAEAAALQNKFWEMHELLYKRQLTPVIFSQLAEELHLNIEQFNKDFDSSEVEEKVQKEFMAGVRSGVNGTPCFYINENRFDGDASYNNLKNLLQDTGNT